MSGNFNLTNCNLAELSYLARYTEYRKQALRELGERMLKNEFRKNV